VDYVVDANLTFSHSGASPVCITGYKSTSSLAMMESEDDEEEARALALGGADDDDDDDEDEDEDEDAPLGVPMNGAASAKQKVPCHSDARAGGRVTVCSWPAPQFETAVSTGRGCVWRVQAATAI
jgi:hypothetical protein